MGTVVVRRETVVEESWACVRASASGRVHVVFVTILYYVCCRVHAHTHVYNNITWTPM